jgi:hypothetical protein
MPIACPVTEYGSYATASSAFRSSEKDMHAQLGKALASNNPTYVWATFEFVKTTLQIFKEQHDKFHATVHTAPEAYSNCQCLFDVLRSNHYHIAQRQMLIAISDPATESSTTEQLFQSYEQVVIASKMHDNILNACYAQLDLTNTDYLLYGNEAPDNGGF